MMNRKTAMTFLLMANLILLAHAVIPHHHHQALVCLENTLYDAESTDHNHHDAEHPDEHDGKNSSECWILKQVVVLPSNQEEIGVKSAISCDNYFSSNNVQAVFHDHALRTFVPIFVTNAHLHYIISDYTHSLTSSRGLRAPPIV